MGEKIRDVRPIHLIGSEVMVELNKGTNKHKGNLIHIQNKKFRYLLTIKDFYKLSADILRARVEFDYIKQHPPKPLYSRAEKKPGDPAAQKKLAELLENGNIRYRLLESTPRVNTILVHPEDRKSFQNYMQGKKYKKAPHPYGKKHGFVFLYRMHEFDLYMAEDDSLIEVYYELPCLSMTPKTWMPLDMHVQGAIWQQERKDGFVSWIDEEDEWIYRMTRCIFEQVKLYEDDLAYFRAHKEIPFRDSIRERMDLVFFGYTDRLLKVLSEDRLEDVIVDYYSYQEY